MTFPVLVFLARPDVLAVRMDATLVTNDPDLAKLGKKLNVLALSTDMQ